MKSHLFFRVLYAFVGCLLSLTGCATATQIDNPLLHAVPPPTISSMPSPQENVTDSDGIWDVSDIPDAQITPGKKYIAFTFDDAPAGTLERILSVFASFNEQNPDCPASATLFCNGIRCTPTALETLKIARLLGFELGNHTYSHSQLPTLTQQQLQQEIDATDALLQTVDGKARHLFRAPFGLLDERTRTYVQTPILNWSIDPRDWTNVDAEHIYQSIWQHRFNGAIVLLHDGYHNTVTALKRLLVDLKADGYQVLSVSALSKANRCPLRIGKEYIRARAPKTAP